MIDVSIVVPAKNEEESIPLLYEEIKKVLGDGNWELIIVDDGSTDKTRDVIIDIHRRDRRVKGVFLSRNFGHQHAIMAGLHHASGNAVIVMDADMQDPPSLIPLMLQKFKEGYEIVYCVRRKREDPLLKTILARIFYKVFRKIAFNMPEDAGDFALMSHRVVKILTNLPERQKFIRGLRAWVGFKWTAIDYERPPRIKGTPKYNYLKSLLLAIDGILAFSFFPLRIVFFMGLIAFAISLLFAVWVFYSLFAGNVVHGWTSTILIILFLGSIQLLSISIIGEYVGRIYEETKKRPPFIVDKTIGFEDKNTDTTS